jgi:hypothetical protein
MRARLQGKGLPSGEPLVEAVPERDLILADVPAEQHVFTRAPRGEIDEAAVEVLHERPDLVDPRDASRNRGRAFAHLLFHGVELARVEVTAVPRDRLRERSVAFLQDGQRSPALDHLLGERTDDRERLVRLLGGEVPRSHGGMIGGS